MAAFSALPSVRGDLVDAMRAGFVARSAPGVWSSESALRKAPRRALSVHRLRAMV